MGYRYQIVAALVFVSFCALGQTQKGADDPTSPPRELAKATELTPYFMRFNSPTLEILRPDSPYRNEQHEHYPEWINWLLQDRFRSSPDTREDATSTECKAQIWYESARAQLEGPAFAEFTRNYLQRCGPQIQRPWSNFFSNIWKTMMLKLDLVDHPYARQVMVHLPNGDLLKGVLALKGDDRPRPLIIFRPGVFSNVSELYPERFVFLQMFEESYFNMLILESTSGQEYVLRNRSLSMGGVEEGLQTFWVAQQLQKKSEPLHSIISEVQIAGVSFGGNGVLVTALLNNLAVAQQPKQPPVIAGAMAYCPLIDMQSTLEAHSQKAWLGPLLNYWVGQRLNGVGEFAKEIHSDRLFTEVKSNLTAVPTRMHLADVGLQAPVGWQLNELDFWQRQKFWSVFPKGPTPMTLIATEKDPMVPYALNSGRLQELLPTVAGAELQVITLPEGWHCSLPGAYLWRPMSALARAAVAHQTRSYPTQNVQAEELLMTAVDLPSLKSAALSLQPGKSAETVTLVLQLAKNGQELVRAEVPIEDLGLAATGSSAALPVLERWALQNIQWQGSIHKDRKYYVRFYWER